METLVIIIYLLLFIIFCLIAFAVVQLRLAGIKVKDFWSFIKANQSLDTLYQFSRRYEKLNSEQQVIFLKEAEDVFRAFEKVPEALWEEEYPKYIHVLNAYKDIKMLRWNAN